MSFTRVSATPGNPGNLLEFYKSSWKNVAGYILFTQISDFG